MYRSAGLVPTRFLVLIAHFTICVNLLWTGEESLKFCSMGSLPVSDPSSPRHLTGFKIGLSMAVGLMCVEFLAFIFGFTMFNSTSALLSIFCHSMACLTLAHFIMDGWQCGWFWWIFTLGSVLPILYDTPSVLYVLCKRTW